jgi:homoserine kinase
MIKISTPATSANLSVGFDTLGLALDIYNEFLFEETPFFHANGFQEVISLEDNLVLQSYLAFAKQHKSEEDIKKITITLLKQDIPMSRGLGSSASCIVAGVLAANNINQLNRTLEECASFASSLEGHPDNVYACIFGSLTAAYRDNFHYYYDKFSVSNSLVFTVLIPEKTSSTKELRSVLPKNLSISDTIFHLSRIIHVPNAFHSGDFISLKRLLKDKIHEQARGKFIPHFEELYSLNKRDDIIVTISGSGSTLLIISSKNVMDHLSKYNSTFSIKQILISEGTRIEGLS